MVCVQVRVPRAGLEVHGLGRRPALLDLQKLPDLHGPAALQSKAGKWGSTHVSTHLWLVPIKSACSPPDGLHGHSLWGIGGSSTSCIWALASASGVGCQCRRRCRCWKLLLPSAGQRRPPHLCRHLPVPPAAWQRQLAGAAHVDEHLLPLLIGGLDEEAAARWVQAGAQAGAQRASAPMRRWQGFHLGWAHATIAICTDVLAACRL